MKKTVYLVNVGNPTRWIAVPFGLAFIAKALIHHDINVEIIDLLPVEPERRREVLERRLAEIGGGAIFGFGMILGNGNVAVTMEFADLVKQASPDNVLVFGGPAATAMPKSIFEHSRADYIVLGEGEERFRLLVEALFEGEREPLIEGVLTREARADQGLPGDHGAACSQTKGPQRLLSAGLRPSRHEVLHRLP